MSRHTSEDAIRHPFIIGKNNNNNLRCNNIHSIINDIERQCRINELINKYKMDLNNENYNLQSTFKINVPIIKIRLTRND